MKEIEKSDLILAKLSDMGQDIAEMKKKMDGMQTQMDGMQTQMDGMQTQMDGMQTQMDGMQTQMDGMQTQMDGMQTQMDDVQREILDVRLTLENETNRNIMRVAEGHLDLSRKLDEALKIENEKEMIAIRVNILENEVRKVKDRIDQIA